MRNTQEEKNKKRADALRENLLKRKEQLRKKATTEAKPCPKDEDEDEDEDEDKNKNKEKK